MPSVKLSDITTITKATGTETDTDTENYIYIKSCGPNAGMVSKSCPLNPKYSYIIDSVDSINLYEQLMNKQQDIYNCAMGSTIMHIKKSDIENIMIDMA